MNDNVNNIGIFEEIHLAFLNYARLCEKYNIDSFIDIYHTKKDKNEKFTSIDFEYPIENEC